MGKLGRFRLAWMLALLTLTGGAALTSVAPNTASSIERTFVWRG
jgi:hypothetical protein